MQSLAEEIHIFLNPGAWENIPRKKLSFLGSFCFCLSVHYLPTLEMGYWARWIFDFIDQFSLKESQNNVQRMMN